MSLGSEDIFGKKGFQVDSFTDANLALQHFRNEFSPFNAHPFDWIVLDIKMPTP
jgi:DNA-binding response OmpR family regulator